jgi:hypothetical protein
MWNGQDPSRIDPRLDSRAVTFENPTGARGAGGSAQGGRKGLPAREVQPGETLVLADLEGPGTIRHVWMTFPPRPPEVMRGLWLEVFYDDSSEPSVSAPCLDFFGLPLGRPVHFVSALAAAQEGRGFNSYFPMPFRRRVRIECTNGSKQSQLLFYQLDYTLEPEPEPELAPETGVLHVAFRRENPTRLARDFTIAQDFRGPGRFLGCNVGIRTLPCDHFVWYGEGEVKIYRDGDAELPTICGTGLEDYVGSAWGMGPHHAHWAGAPLEVRDPGGGPVPEFVSFYRWHVPDPVIFERDLRVTIQQIGYAVIRKEDADEVANFEKANPPAGTGWIRSNPALAVRGIAERVDDYCATAYVYCRDVQPVPRLDVAAALADIERRPFESPSGTERAMTAME